MTEELMMENEKISEANGEEYASPVTGCPSEMGTEANIRNDNNPVRKNDGKDDMEDSESSDSDNGTFTRMRRKKAKNVKVRIESDSDPDDEDETADKPMSISHLIDPESEEEEESQRHEPIPDEPDPDNGIAKGKKSVKAGKLKSSSKRAAKDEAMSKIYSETQRLIRESSVSLPYHRPKQRTLEEFLNRKKIAPALPKASTMAVKVKISATIVGKALEEKEKEAEAFYVELSDSDAETVDPANHSPLPEQMSIEETQKLQKIDIQHRQNVIHNASLEHGVSRKLFLDATPVESALDDTPIEEPRGEDCKKLHKELKRDLKDIGIPRKLFNSNFEEGAGTPVDNDNINHQSQSVSEEVSKIPEVEASEITEDSCISDTPMMTDKEFLRVQAVNNKSLIDNKVEASDKADSISSTSTKKSALLNMKNCKPKIRGNPGMMIDLTESSKPNKAAINNLMDRFLMKHAVINKQEEKTTEVTILHTEITSDGLKINKDILSYKSKSDKIDQNELDKPGAKLKRLQEELKKRMASKRCEEWKQKEEKDVEADDEVFEEYDEEENPRDSESDGESEPEINDIVLKDKKPKNHAFCDDEAEVSDEEILELSEDENEDEIEEEEEEEADGEDEAEEEWEGNETDSSRKFTRIIQIAEDSNSMDDISQSNVSQYPSKEKLQRTDTDVEIFDEEELLDTNVNLSISQPPSITPESTTNNQLSSLPEDSQINSLSQISFLNSTIGTIDNSKKSVVVEQFDKGKGKLFEDESNSTVNDDELIEICSGKFPDAENSTFTNTQKIDLGPLVNSALSEGVTDSQLMNLCSGSFPTQSPLSQSRDNKEFRSSVERNSQRVSTNVEENSKSWNIKMVSSSDEEDESENTQSKERKKKKKKVKKLILSDDEEDDEKEEYSEEESEIESDEEKFIDYDSEENEVIVVPKRDIKQVAANFLEKEAELSESEWGSEDEDERDLDKYECEEADSEVIDENQMRYQIGKIHARQLLDEDNRDVKMLKELLFDDGDLHDDGGGRERKFRWKNIDKIGLENLPGSANNYDEDDGIEEENYDPASELEWRKARLEKQRFLEEKKKTEANEIYSDLADGEILKLGLKILEKNKTSAREQLDSNEETRRKSIAPRSVSELVQYSSNKSCLLKSAFNRGSFLARGEQALAKLAVMIKQTDTIALASKNSGNFIFTHLSPPEEEDEDYENEKISVRKRKSTAANMTPKTTKKPRIEVEKLPKI